MNLSGKFIVFQSIILFPFIIGYFSKDKMKDIAGITRKLIRFNLILIEPIIALWSIWGLKLDKALIFLPVGGMFLVFLGWTLGFVLSLFLHLSRKSRATYLISSSLANHGFTMGGFLCYLFLGETGLGYSFLFLAYFVPYIYLFIFPYAMRMSRVNAFSLREALLNLQNMPLYAVIAALGLHWAGIQRPGIELPVDILLVISIPIYYYSLGLNFRFSDIKSLGREAITMGMSKFLILPVLTFLILMVIPAREPVKLVIFIQSFMPAAIYSVLASILYDLDTPQASGLFIVNTVTFLLVVLPALFWAKPYLIMFIR